LTEFAGEPQDYEPYAGRRSRLVKKTVEEWKSALVDLGGRNNLLHYRDLKQGTLDLTIAAPDAVSGLLAGKATRVSWLFGSTDQREQALRRVRVIHNKAKENSEERGLETASIGCGLATWANKRGAWEPSAPVLLQSVALRPLGAAQDDFELAVTGEMEVNPTLLHALKVDFGCEVDQAALTGRIDGSINEPWELLETYAWIAEQARLVQGFRVDERMVLANFAYAKLAMVRDLDAALDEMTEHDLIAALAGDEQARAAIRAKTPGPGAVPSPDSVPLADEFLILDADSSQNYAINAVLGGQSLIIKGPPGTGKSQTISNLIASLAARGKKVLFVAEKRAAIDAVTKRLGQQKLGELVLDLHGGVTSKRAFAHSIGQALEASRSARRIDNGADLAQVERRREQLNAYVRALHDRRQPWNLSVYEIQSQLLGLKSARTDFRLRGNSIMALDQSAADQAGRDLARYADLGGLTLAAGDSPWGRSPIVSDDEVRQADNTLNEVLRHALPGTWRQMERACRAVCVPLPEKVGDWGQLIMLWTSISAVASTFSPAIYGLDLAAERTALAAAQRGGLARMQAAVISSDYRAARTRVRATLLPGRKVRGKALYSHMAAAHENAGRWAGIGGRQVPRAPEDLDGCRAAYGHLADQLTRLERWVGEASLAAMMMAADLQRVLERLDADRATLGKLPELHKLRTRLEGALLGGLLDGLARSQTSADFAVECLRYTWLQSILDYLALSDLSVGSFSAQAHQRAVEEYSEGDHRHIDATPSRIRRMHAEAVVRALDEFPEQASIVRHQAALKRRHLPVRDLVRNTADVLLTLKPCWAMSPLVVSQLLPAEPYFDVVIFDEASQVTPADAATSILRGRQLVVAGDDKQLPPSAFFASGSAEEGPTVAEEDAPLLAGTAGFESILNALGSVLSFRMLTWHYRSRDERLIVFSNEHIYDRMLTTFPGAGGGRVLRHVPAAWSATATTNSPAPEVNAVVDLIFEHARERPDESLGVITMGIEHRNRIEETLRQRLRGDRLLADQLSGFFDETREERFFVKNLERVQGDERDAIILSIGYGKDNRGHLPYRFGPLLTEGGERRLNVAVTRAKNRLTLVSSFSAQDMDPERSAAEGVKLLRKYLQYVESGGTNLGDQVPDKPALNPFEADVRDTLTRSGLSLTPQYGASGYWIDFAVRHPLQPGQYVLAIECDGATYHSSESARDRDRLRQEQLERLGWRFHRIWSSDWFRHKDDCVAKVMGAYDQALRAADSGEPAWPRPAIAEVASFADAAPVGAERNAALRPFLIRGNQIDEYSDSELDRLARWIRSDEVLRTEDEILQEMMRELGFQRRGKNVVARLNAAIAHTRQSR
jgi:very-short-patch-repair endonuclease/DNA polymerase III delta prime subunit